MKLMFSKQMLWWAAVFLAATIARAFALLFSVGQSIWFDEGYSILLARSSWSELFALTAVDAHPPFYYVLLKAWGSIFGFSDIALRSLSAGMLSASVIVVAVLLRKMFSARVALLALPFIVLAPFLIRYGYEIRMYATAMFIGVIATYVLVSAQQSGKRWVWAIYAVLVALGMYTLYMMAVVWLAHVAWLLSRSLKKPRRPLREWKWVYAVAGSVLLFLPYTTTFVYQIVHSALPGIGNPITLTKLVDMTTVLLAFRSQNEVGSWLSLLLLTAIIATIWAGVQVRRYLSSSEKTYFNLLALLVVVPIVFYIITSLPPRDPIFVNRYLAHVAIFFYALVGVTLALAVVYRHKVAERSHRFIPFIAYGVTLTVFIVGLVQLHAVGNFIFERKQSPQTQLVREAIECSDETTVVADDPYTYIDAIFYFQDCNMTFYSPSQVEKKGGYAPLHGSEARVESPSSLTSPVLVRLGWAGGAQRFIPDARYQLVGTETFDKQLVETYRLIEE